MTKQSKACASHAGNVRANIALEALLKSSHKPTHSSLGTQNSLIRFLHQVELHCTASAGVSLCQAPLHCTLGVFFGRASLHRFRRSVPRPNNTAHQSAGVSHCHLFVLRASSVKGSHLAQPTEMRTRPKQKPTTQEIGAHTPKTTELATITAWG